MYSCMAMVHMPIGLVSRVFANGPGDQSSISGRVIPKGGVSGLMVIIVGNVTVTRVHISLIPLGKI